MLPQLFWLNLCVGFVIGIVVFFAQGVCILYVSGFLLSFWPNETLVVLAIVAVINLLAGIATDPEVLLSFSVGFAFGYGTPFAVSLYFLQAFTDSTYAIFIILASGLLYTLCHGIRRGYRRIHHSY